LTEKYKVIRPFWGPEYHWKVNIQGPSLRTSPKSTR
jgi:hypothetical protein